MPIFPSLGVANVVLKLTQHEANDVFFREVRASLLSGLPLLHFLLLMLWSL